MKILLDHNLDRRLKRYLTEHETATTQERGWSDVLNGELIALAERSGFDVLITADSNIKTQQLITGRKIAIVVLRACNNRLVTHVEMIGDIKEAVRTIQPGQIIEVLHPAMLKP